MKQVADIGPVVAPEKYDADLEGKSDYVKKTVRESGVERSRSALIATSCVMCWSVLILLPWAVRSNMRHAKGAAACGSAAVHVNYHAR